VSNESKQKEFFAALAQDEQMQRELQEKYATEQGVPEEDVRQFAADKGYVFSFEDDSGNYLDMKLTIDKASPLLNRKLTDHG
jgi:hypothetical protein